MTMTNDQCDDLGNSNSTTSINANEKDIENRRSVEGSIVVVAKCPIPGSSKTRLIPLLGKEGSVRLARSMLSDVLKTIDGCVSVYNWKYCTEQSSTVFIVSIITSTSPIYSLNQSTNQSITRIVSFRLSCATIQRHVLVAQNK